MKKRNIKYLLPVFFLLAFLQSCKKDLIEYAPFSELGAQANEYIVPSSAGEVKVKILSNADFTVNISQDDSWLSSNAKNYSGDTSITFTYQANDSFNRMAVVPLYSDAYDRYDTLYIKQRGTENAKMQFPVLNTSVLGDGGGVSVKLNANIPFDDVKVNIVYPEANGDLWVSDDFTYNQQDSLLSFTVEPNRDPVKLRNAQIKLSYIDGWGQEISSTLYLVQANANNEFGTLTDFTAVRSWAGERITSDIYIEGIIISDAKNPNASEHVQTTPTAINYTETDRVTYIQTFDGKYGFKIVTSTVNDNIFKSYSKVKILLKGTSVNKETNPDYYTISGVTSMMVLSQEEGTASNLANKSKYISELTDDDIFTYVTLKDTEFPIRKGSFTPINEGYATPFNAHRVAKYPLVMRDIQGENIFLMTNTRVPYRRDGAILPYGSGDVSGVIVHEKFTRFEYEDDVTEDKFGNIGRYQIRHLSKSDIKISSDFNSGFSALVTEFQYPVVENGVAKATFGNGSISSSVSTVNLARTFDYSYLGPIGNTSLGNNNKYGNGVMLGNTKQNQEATTNSDGKGQVINAAISGNTLWWNEAKQRGEAFVLDFSTQGISTDKLSLQFTMANLTGGTGKGAPRYWKVEWSDHGNMDGSWNTIAPFTVPDVPLWANTTIHQLAGYKNYTFNLPLTLLGKSKVYIRLIVDRNLASDGNSYASEPLTAASNTGLGYLGIRYNK